MSSIPDSHRDLLNDPIYVTLVTLMPDGQPQASVVWCSYDGSHVLVNSARNRQKDKNMVARPQVTILAVDPKNPYRYLEVRGTVVENTEDGAKDHINALAKTYRGVNKYYGGVSPAEMEGKETRVIYKVQPTRVRAISPRA